MILPSVNQNPERTVPRNEDDSLCAAMMDPRIAAATVNQSVTHRLGLV